MQRRLLKGTINSHQFLWSLRLHFRYQISTLVLILYSDVVFLLSLSCYIYGHYLHSALPRCLVLIAVLLLGSTVSQFIFNRGLSYMIMKLHR